MIAISKRRKRIVALELAERTRMRSRNGDAAPRRCGRAGRALALDPKSHEAADLVTMLILEPPKEQPAALREQLMASEIAVQRRQGRVALGSFAAVIGFLAVSAWNGITDWTLLAMLFGLSVLHGSVAFIIWRREMSSREILLVSCGNALLVALMSRMFGSLLIAPAVTCIMTLSLTSYPQNIDRARIVIAIMVTSWLMPVILEWTGVIGRTWSVVGGAIVSTSSMFRIGGTATVTLLVFANVLTIRRVRQVREQAGDVTPRRAAPGRDPGLAPPAALAEAELERRDRGLEALGADARRLRRWQASRPRP